MQRMLLTITLIATLLFSPSAQAKDQYQEYASVVGGVLTSLSVTTIEMYGSLADGLIAGTFTRRYAAARALGTSNALGTNIKTLNALHRSGKASVRDLATLKKYIRIIENLKIQGDALGEYALKNDKSQAKLYRKMNKQNWKDICKLLNFDAELSELLKPGGDRLGL